MAKPHRSNAKRRTSLERTPAVASERSAGDGDVRLNLLTPREREVLVLALELYHPKPVAALLGTSPQTVRNQIASIVKKLGFQSREELLAKLSRQGAGLLPNPPQESDRHS